MNHLIDIMREASSIKVCSVLVAREPTVTDTLIAIESCM